MRKSKEDSPRKEADEGSRRGWGQRSVGSWHRRRRTRRRQPTSGTRAGSAGPSPAESGESAGGTQGETSEGVEERRRCVAVRAAAAMGIGGTGLMSRRQGAGPDAASHLVLPGEGKGRWFAPLPS